MKIKKYLLILCIVLVFIGVLGTVNALKIEKLDDTSVVIHKNKSIITTHITPTDSPSKTKMKKELNKINKIVVKINGKTVNTIKKGKGWKKYVSFSDNFPTTPTIIDRTTIVKKNPKWKTLGIYVYNSKNKLIKSKISTIKPTHVSKVKITKKKAIKITKDIKDKYPIKITSAALKKGNYYLPYYWKVAYTEPGGAKWREYIYIDAINGDTFNPLVNLI